MQQDKHYTKGDLLRSRNLTADRGFPCSVQTSIRIHTFVYQNRAGRNAFFCSTCQNLKKAFNAWRLVLLNVSALLALELIRVIHIITFDSN